VILPSAKKNSHTSSSKKAGTEKKWPYGREWAQQNLLLRIRHWLPTAKLNAPIKKAVVKKQLLKRRFHCCKKTATKKQLLQKAGKTKGLQKIIFQIGYRTEYGQELFIVG